MLTLDEKFDVPALVAALETPAAYIGAMDGEVNGRPRKRLRRKASATRSSPAYAPIDLAISARSPEEVAVAIGAQIVEATAERHATTVTSSFVGLLS